MMQREVSWPAAMLALAQATVFSIGVVLAIFVGTWWPTIAALGVLGAEAIRTSIRGRTARTSVWVMWTATGFFWVMLLAEFNRFYEIELYHLLIAIFAVIGIALAEKGCRTAGKGTAWKGVAVAWVLIPAMTWLAGSYMANRIHEFHFAAAATVLGLVASRIFLRLPGAAIQVVHTLILLLVGLPLADAFTRPSYVLDTNPEKGKNYYSFEAARKDPTAFGSWWYHFMNEWDELHEVLAVRDKEGAARYRMVPNSQGRIFDSTIKINSLGFRGPEIPLEKGKAYRILALGESTTFGITIRKDGKPWPRLLEKMLNKRLKPARPIQVINAGVYGLTIEENLRRLKQRLLRLRPDMLISYHGHNYFMALNAAIPPPQGEPLPEYENRPLKLLADFEYQVKVRWYRRSRAPRLDLDGPSLEDPMETAYAEKYRELIQVARRNHIKLVLANYSMSVNAKSDEEVIEFYRAGFPSVIQKIQANEIHTRIVEELARKNPDIIYVDTQPVLDGRHEKYIDLVHFTQEGRQDMADMFYEAIKDVVAKEAGKKAKPGKPTLITGAETDEKTG